MRRVLITDCRAAPLQCPPFLRCLPSLFTVKRTYHLPHRRLTLRSLSVASRSRHRHRHSIAPGIPPQILLLLKLPTPLLRRRRHRHQRLSVPLQRRLKSGTTPTWRCWAHKIPSSSESCWRDQIQRSSCHLTDLGHCLRLLFLHYCTAYA